MTLQLPSVEDCTATGFSGEGRCIEPVADGELCRDHADQPVLRCFCGRFISRKTRRCSQLIACYREGTFVGWEHP
jgi:hypothetical protein